MNKQAAKKTGTGRFLLIAMIFFVSCNKPFPNTLPEDNGTAPAHNNLSRKTLLIIVDGAVGNEVRTIAPPTLNSLVDFSIFSWDALNNYVNVPVTNALSWTTLLTGTNLDKHKVTGNDFTGNDLATYPSLFTRLKQQKPQLRTSAFLSSAPVADFLALDASDKRSFNEDDAAVKESVKAELATKDPALLVAQFHSVDKAGETNSYTAASTPYRNAVLQVDAYIGEILDAMRSRKSFKDENWMVIITSNKGSNTVYAPVGAPWSAFNDTRHNTFFFCYNPRFKSQNPSKPTGIIPYIGTSPLYSGTLASNRRAKVETGGNLYDIGATGSFTIQCKVKIPTGSYNYPAFMAKRASFTAGVPGWCFFMEGNYWQINFGQVALGNRQIRGHAISDGQWHTLTVVIKQEGAARNVYTYTDGVLYPGITAANKNIASYGNLNSPAPLTVGNLPPDNNTGLQNYFVTNVKIYKDAFTDAYIANNFCKTDLDNDYASSLLGFWPCMSVTPEKTMADLSSNARNMVIESYNPGSINDISTTVCPPVSEEIYRTVPNSVDVAVQIYQWLGIPVPPAWGLDGKSFIPSYSDLGG